MVYKIIWEYIHLIEPPIYEAVKKNWLLSPISIEGDIALGSVSLLSISGRGRQYSITISSSPCSFLRICKKQKILQGFAKLILVPHGFAKIMKKLNLSVDQRS
jgi:hypothetical protein